MNNGEYIRNNYMQDNKNMAEYFMCIGCEYDEQCNEAVDDMINRNNKCNQTYQTWLNFLNSEYK
jgi:hypothetical protein